MTTVAQDEAMVAYMLEHRREAREGPAREVQAACLRRRLRPTKVKVVDPVTEAVTWLRNEMVYRYEVHRRSVARRLAAADFKARIPAAKEQYTAAELESRRQYAHAALAKPAGWFDNVVFTDEVKVIWARGQTLRRLLGKRVRFVYRRPGERFHPDCIKGRHMKNNMDGISLKFFVAVWAGQLVMCVDAARYLPLSQSAKQQIDQHCYAKYLEELAEDYRERCIEWNALGLMNPPLDPSEIHLLQDNWRVHNAPASRAAAARCGIRIVEGQPTRSPDLNPIENVFARLAERLDQMYRDPAKADVSRDEFVADVRAVLEQLEQEGILRAICSDRSMRKRCNEVLEANGGAGPH